MKQPSFQKWIKQTLGPKAPTNDCEMMIMKKMSEKSKLAFINFLTMQKDKTVFEDVLERYLHLIYHKHDEFKGIVATAVQNRDDYYAKLMDLTSQKFETIEATRDFVSRWIIQIEKNRNYKNLHNPEDPEC